MRRLAVPAALLVAGHSVACNYQSETTPETSAVATPAADSAIDAYTEAVYGRLDELDGYSTIALVAFMAVYNEEPGARPDVFQAYQDSLAQLHAAILATDPRKAASLDQQELVGWHADVVLTARALVDGLGDMVRGHRSGNVAQMRSGAEMLQGSGETNIRELETRYEQLLSRAGLPAPSR
jgi:hypothetical protein